MTDPLDITLHASASEGSSGSGAAVDLGSDLRCCAKLKLIVSAMVGTTPSLLVAIETSADGSTGWTQVGAFATVTVAGFQEVTFAETQRFVRASWTLAGTGGPACTFSVAGRGHVLYARPSDLSRIAIPAAALQNVTPAEQADAMLAVTDEAAGYIGGSYQLPLTAWDDDLRMHVARMGAYAVISARGYDPTGRDDTLVKGRDDAIAWLRRIMDGQLEPPGMIDSTPDEFEGGAYVVTQVRRGW